MLGLISPGDEIQLLAEIGIFFLMFHAGVETQPLEFYDALKRSLGVAIVGAAGLFVEAIGLHRILGACLVGLFFEEEVAHPSLVRVVKDRLGNRLFVPPPDLLHCARILHHIRH